MQIKASLVGALRKHAGGMFLATGAPELGSEEGSC